MKVSFQKLFFAIATLFALVAVLMLAKTILIPLAFSLLLAFILYPLAKRFEAWGINRIFAAFLSLLVVALVFSGIIFFFSTQIYRLTKEVTHFQHKIILTFASLTAYINNNLNFIPNLGENELYNQIKEWISGATGAIALQTFNNTAAFFPGLLTTVVFTFLILIYRRGLTVALSGFSPAENRGKVVKMFKSVQQVGQKYFLGMIILIVIIGLANSFGLWIIGIDNPFLFGFLGAVLSIIPYVGTVAGAIIPILYAFMFYDSLWIPIAVAILFWAVQLISDNILSPRIVGGSLRINALTAILSLIVGAIVWGVAGMILFLPFAAMLKVVCEEYEQLKPIALLIGNENYRGKHEENIFLSKLGKQLQKAYAKIQNLIK